MEINIAQLSGIVTLAMLLSGTLIYSPDKTYYCPGLDMVLECTKGLSSSGITCYYLDAKGVKVGKQCSGGWKPISQYIKPSETPKLLTGSGAGWHWDEIEGNKYLCRDQKCILNGQI